MVTAGVKPLILEKDLARLKTLAVDGKYAEYIEQKEQVFCSHLRNIANSLAKEHCQGKAPKFQRAISDEIYAIGIWGFFACDTMRDIEFENNWKSMWGVDDKAHDKGR